MSFMVFSRGCGAGCRRRPGDRAGAAPGSLGCPRSVSRRRAPRRHGSGSGRRARGREFRRRGAGRQAAGDAGDFRSGQFLHGLLLCIPVRAARDRTGTHARDAVAVAPARIAKTTSAISAVAGNDPRPSGNEASACRDPAVRREEPPRGPHEPRDVPQPLRRRLPAVVLDAHLRAVRDRGHLRQAQREVEVLEVQEVGRSNPRTASSAVRAAEEEAPLAILRETAPSPIRGAALVGVERLAEGAPQEPRDEPPHEEHARRGCASPGTRAGRRGPRKGVTAPTTDAGEDSEARRRSRRAPSPRPGSR